MKDAGRLAVAEGLRNGDEAEVLTGRRAMQGAAAAVDQMGGAEHIYTEAAGLRALALEAMDPEWKARFYTAALETTSNASRLDQIDNAVLFMAERMLRHEHELDPDQRLAAVMALHRLDTDALRDALKQPEPAAE